MAPPFETLPQRQAPAAEGREGLAPRRYPFRAAAARPAVAAPRVSVILPTYGRGPLVAELLGTLAAQTLRPVEVLVVDDTPDDEVKRVCVSGAAGPGVPVRYTRPPGRPSLTRARNHGISRATGDVLCFLDSDVRPAPTYLARMVEALDDASRPTVVQAFVPHRWKHRGWKGVVFRLLHQGRNVGTTMRFRLPMRNTFPDRRADAPVASEWVSGSNMVIHRARLGDVRFDDALERYCLAEDVDFSLRLRAAGKTMLLVPDETVTEGNEQGGRIPHRDLERMRVVNLRHILATHFPDRRWRARLTWQDLGWILHKYPLRDVPGALARYFADRRAVRPFTRRDGGVRLPEANVLYSFWEDAA
jgi:GT2 family glycosyltransferase